MLVPKCVAIATVLLGIAVPAAAHVIGPGSDRTGASIAMGVALIGVITGGLALRRASRDAAVAAGVLAAVGAGLAVLHLVTSPGAIGTGHGRAGAILGLVLGAIGLFLARRALARSSRQG
jgi:hypothetical protein